MEEPHAPRFDEELDVSKDPDPLELLEPDKELESVEELEAIEFDGDFESLEMLEPELVEEPKAPKPNVQFKLLESLECL